MREGLSWHDMETDNDALGRPIMRVAGGVADRLATLAAHENVTETRIHITLSDEAGLAKATILLEGVPSMA
jgi:holo-[acyl-carrier protein] synthase